MPGRWLHVVCTSRQAEARQIYTFFLGSSFCRRLFVSICFQQLLLVASSLCTVVNQWAAGPGCLAGGLVLTQVSYALLASTCMEANQLLLATTVVHYTTTRSTVLQFVAFVCFAQLYCSYQLLYCLLSVLATFDQERNQKFSHPSSLLSLEYCRSTVRRSTYRSSRLPNDDNSHPPK